MAFFNKVTVIPFPRNGSDNQWEIRVEYAATFDAGDLGKNFREGFLLFELDDTSADDKLTPSVVGVQEFVATDTTMFRTMRTLISGDVLDTELGGEELYAVARLRHLDKPNQPVAVLNSQVAPIAP
jgi:hypothetical protein